MATKLSERVATRKQAKEAFGILQDLAKEQGALDEVFWQELQELLATKVAQPVVVAKSPIVPMDDEEARKFEKTKVPFAWCDGKSVGETDFAVLDRICGYTFVDDLRRYMANASVQRFAVSG